MYKEVISNYLLVCSKCQWRKQELCGTSNYVDFHKF